MMMICIMFMLSAFLFLVIYFSQSFRFQTYNELVHIYVCNCGHFRNCWTTSLFVLTAQRSNRQILHMSDLRSRKNYCTKYQPYLLSL